MISERHITEEISFLEKSIQRVSDELERLKKKTSGDDWLRAARYRDGYQYFVRKRGMKGNGEYIKKANVKMASMLAQIEYDKKLEIVLQRVLFLLLKCKEAGLDNPFTYALAKLSDGKRKLVSLPYCSDESYIENWMVQDYEGLPFRGDFPEYYTRKGLRVRSKSEVIIADMLDEMSIPFRYEKPLQLKNRTIHPDFTLLNIKERKEVYWEHFGMMDDREYRDEAFLKIREYETNGFYQYDSAIWTFESGKYPINTRDIRNMVKKISDTFGY